MHREKADVPIGEFVDALKQLRQAGRIGTFSGSNWTTARITEAKAYAAANGLQPMSILNNNQSLAVMEHPVWKGCVGSNKPESRAYLRQNDVTHVSWPSQARGYFLPEALRARVPADTAAETSFGSPTNEARGPERKRWQRNTAFRRTT